MTEQIKIITVDDHQIFRKGLNFILNQIPGISLIAEADDGTQLISLLEQKLIPDIVLIDIRMPHMDGIEATTRALQLYPGLKIVALSMFGEETYLEKMIAAGACGFLLKHIDKKELELAIHQICEGNQYYSAELLPYFTRKFIRKPDEKKETDGFTSREIEILDLVARGMTSKEIAETLYISKRTVEGHKANMIEKTGSKNIVELLIHAIKHRLVKIT